MRTQAILPVLLSCLVIVLIAILERHSKVLAAITATMPLTVTLGLWVVYRSSDGDRAQVGEFAQSLLVSIFPSVFFLVVVSLAARAGWRLLPMILSGYAAWGLGLALLFGVRAFFGL